MDAVVALLTAWERDGRFGTIEIAFKAGRIGYIRRLQVAKSNEELEAMGG